MIQLESDLPYGVHSGVETAHRVSGISGGR